MKRFLTVFFALSLLVVVAVQAATQNEEQIAGKVSQIKGSALAVQDANVRPLKVGDTVLIGDILSTGADSRLEIIMLDEGRFKLGARTSFVISDYTFGQGNDNLVVELLNGAMDGVSGQIAKTAENGLNIHTKQATIGIRGTKFFVGEIDGQMSVAHWSGGGVLVKNQAGEVFLKGENQGTHLISTSLAPTPIEDWSGDKKHRAKALVD